MTNGSLMKVKSIAECSPWKPIFCLLESGRFTQVLLYCIFKCTSDYFYHGSKYYENKGGKDQETVQLNATPDPVHHMGK